MLKTRYTILQAFLFISHIIIIIFSGRILTGVVRKTKMQRTIIIRRDYLHFVKKYGRFEKRHNVSFHYISQSCNTNLWFCEVVIVKNHDFATQFFQVSFTTNISSPADSYFYEESVSNVRQVLNIRTKIFFRTWLSICHQLSWMLTRETLSLLANADHFLRLSDSMWSNTQNHQDRRSNSQNSKSWKTHWIKNDLTSIKFYLWHV